MIDAYKSDEEGRRKAKTFMRVVAHALRNVSHRSEFHLVMLGVEELQEFVYDSGTNDRTRTQAMRNFSSIDLTFVGGDSGLSPWHPRAAFLLAYLNQCVVAGSHLLGDEVAVRMLWHLACVNGRQLHVIDVLNSDGRDRDEHVMALMVPRAYCGSTSVMLDETTGEAFQFGDEELEDEKNVPEKGRIQTVPVRCCNVGVRRRHLTNLPINDGRPPTVF